VVPESGAGVLVGETRIFSVRAHVWVHAWRLAAQLGAVCNVRFARGGERQGRLEGQMIGLTFMNDSCSRVSSLAVCLLIQAFLPAVLASAEKQLTQKQAEELLLNIPDAIAAKSKRGCPSVYLLWPNEKEATLVFSMHNPCD